MEVQLPLLFANFNRYLDRLNSDLARIADRLPSEKRGAFRIAEYDFETFRENWGHITGDQSLLESWLQRLSPTGYDDDRIRFLAAMGDITFSAPTVNKAAA